MKLGTASLVRIKPLHEIYLFVFSYLLVCFFILAFSPLVMLYVGHDITPVIDGVWRIENGQIPHKDFSSILGYGYLLHQYLFLKIFNYNFIAFNVSSIAITSIIFAGFLCLYSSQTFIRNTNIILRIYLFLLIVSLGLGQYNFGTGYKNVTYANLYNRYCFTCLLLLFLLTTLLKNKNQLTTRVIISIIIIGIIANYLLFVKITYCAVALGLLTLLLILKQLSFKLYACSIIASLLIFFVVLVITKADFPAILNDYKTISNARKNVLISPHFLRSKLWQPFCIIFLVSSAILMLQLFLKKVSMKFIAIIAYLGLASIFLHITNWGESDIVMLSFMPVAFILFPKGFNYFSYRLILIVSLLFVAKNILSIYSLSTARDNEFSELKSKYLSGFYTNFQEYKCGEDYATKVMSGVTFINENKRPGDKVFAFAFDNPFPFLTQTVPPKCVLTVWQAATTYSYAVHPNPKTLFSDVELLMIPTCLKAESATEMMILYGRVVTNHYEKIDSNNYWNLYRKIKPL